MALHPQVAVLLEGLAALDIPAIETQSAVDARVGMAAMTVPSTVELHEIRQVDAGGVPARLYRPRSTTRLGLLVYYHGGGWVLGSIDTHDDVCRKLARATGHAVLSVDYRLAPEHPFPAPLEDSVNALRWAHENATELGVDPSRIAVGGDSAGGNLAAVVANLAPVPLRYQMLIYPVTDATRSSASYVENAEGYRLTAAGMKWFCDHYLSGDVGSETDPRVSPLFASEHVLADAAPAVVITAEYDPLRDEGEDYAQRLMEAGVACTLARYPGMIHGFFSMSELVDDGMRAIEHAAALVKMALEA
ncbi:MAG: alpha/beta hydrolase [Actinobacteria bacterium]|nr:alpha/beta hydrolase [Actinomycetota bacterium]